MKKYKKLITYGTFDLFHIGHLNLLKRLKAMTEELIVAVSTDEFNSLKKKKSLIPFEHRAKIVESIKYVDQVIPEKDWEQKILDIKSYGIDAFAIGDDWKGEFDYLKEFCDVIYLDRTKNVSSTQLKKSLKNFLSVSPEDLNIAFSILSQLKQDLE